MLTGREQSAALRFAVRRRMAALTRGVSDAHADLALPKDRSVALGVVFAVLAIGAAAAYGWLAGPRTEPPPDNGTVVISGTNTYLVMIDGVAHPALNTASALLAADSVTAVDSAALADVPRGAPIGIPGAPDSIPASAALTDETWAVCVLPGTEQRRPAVAVGGEPLPVLADYQAVVLADPDGAYWLASAGRRHAIDADALIALGISPDAAVAVPSELVELLATGTPLTAEQVPQQVDQVVRRTTPAGTTYLGVVAGQLATLTPVAAALLADGPITEAATTEPTTSVTVPADWPTAIPKALDVTDHITCALSESGQLAALGGIPANASLVDDDAAPAAVIVGRDRAALVRIPAEPSDEYLLVTDAGRAYRIDDSTAVQRLGYQPDDAIELPPAAYALVPRGPELSVAAARQIPA